MESIIFAVGLLLGWAAGSLYNSHILKDAEKRLELANSKLEEAAKRNRDTIAWIEEAAEARAKEREEFEKKMTEEYASYGKDYFLNKWNESSKSV